MKSILPIITSALVSSVSYALPPEKIHAEVSPSVVFINDIDSLGSGVVLTSDGYILTNYHVVASGLPLTVTAEIFKFGKKKIQKFENVKVLKVHKDYDLALLKLDLKGFRLKAARKASSRESLVSGSVCYAIGNPDGLEKSITQGLVSSTKRNHEGLNYIQISAALNPGNSGGAVCDKNGRLIGIATWKLGDSDNIGFAIPTANLKPTDFIEVTKRKSDTEKGGQFERKANEIFANLRKNKAYLSNAEYQIGISYVTQLYKKSLFYMPGESSPYHNLGLMYFELKDYKTSLKFLKISSKINPKSATTSYLLGHTYTGLKKTNQAMKHWLKGIKDKSNIDDAAKCAVGCAQICLTQKKFAQTAYYLKWAQQLDSNVKFKDQLWREASKKINDGQYAYINHNSSFSSQDLKKYLKLTSADSKKILRRSTNNRGLQEANSAGNYNFKALLKKAKNESLSIPQEGLTLHLPEAPKKVIAAYGSRYLLMHFLKYKCIGVFDICTHKFIRFVNTPDENLKYTAGGNTMVTYSPSEKKFEVYNMSTWKKVKEVKKVTSDYVQDIIMGLQNDKSMLILTGGGDGERFSYLNLQSGRIKSYKTSISGSAVERYRHYTSLKSPMAISESGRLLLYSTTSFDSVIKLRQDTLQIKVNPPSQSYGYRMISNSSFLFNNYGIFHPGQTGKLFDFSKNGYSISSSAQVFGQRAMVIGARYNKSKSVLSVLSAPSGKPLFEVELPKGFHTKRNDKVFASGYLKKCGIIFADQKKLTIYNYGGVVVKEDSQPTPGSLFVRKLTLQKGDSITIEDGPEGLTYDAKTSSLRWKIPIRQQKNKEIAVVLLLKKADGSEDYLLEKIFIQ